MRRTVEVGWENESWGCTMKRMIVSVVFAFGLLAGGVGVAGAAEPNNQACVGESLSVLASNQPAPGAFGQAVVGFAQFPVGQPGLGDAIQALQAGVVPDNIVPNTCNNP
jgi:hypothetical protein